MSTETAEPQAKAAHTAGPWTVGPWHLSPHRTYVRKNSGHTDDGPKDFNIAELNCILDEWQANARLIAAAPELFAALVALSDAIGVGYNVPKYLRPAWDKARAAIAKATGQ